MSIFNLISFICLALCVVIFLYVKWYMKKRVPNSDLDERKIETAKLIAEIDRITDRDAQLVEDRVVKLKELLHDVDSRIALYEKEIEELKKTKADNAAVSGIRPPETLYTSLGRGINAALQTPAAPLPLFEEEEKEEERKEKKEESVEVKPVSKKQIRTHIDLLANEGLSPEEIASRLGVSVAEVNLAINLRRK